MTQRALIIAALNDRPAVVEGALVCDDSRHLSALLRHLGAGVEWRGDRVEVTPLPTRISSDGSPRLLGNAGTAVRFGSCLALLCEGPLLIDGDQRMRQRPIHPLADALRQLGAKVAYLEAEGCPPIRIERSSEIGARVELDGSLSSQYASGLLLVAPHLVRGLEVSLTGLLVSTPYLQMTIEMMSRAGASVDWPSPGQIQVSPSRYSCERLSVEADWSTAAFLIAGGELVGHQPTIENLVEPDHSLQGDAIFRDHIDRIRRQTAVDDILERFDLAATPDLIAPLAAVAVFAARPTSIRGVAHARAKECDRIKVLATELRKLGTHIDEFSDGLDIYPLRALPAGEIELDPSDDHRMAMTFGLLSLRVPGIVVRDPQCVSKSYPAFWEELERFRYASPVVSHA